MHNFSFWELIMRVAGRKRIYTDYKEITRDNIIEVLRKAYNKHRDNVRDMQELIDYYGGLQRLPYSKTVRPEINLQTANNLAKFTVLFHCGYFWGIPSIYIQRGNKEHHNTDETADSTGISALNEMLINGLSIGKENQKLAHFVEICGIGYRLVDIKTDWKKGNIQNSYVNLYTLDPRNSFCVYYNGIGEKKVLGVTYVKTSSGKLMFTCFTEKERFEISGWNIEEDSVSINPLGMIPIVEYNRAIDLTGCFESQRDMMDNLNSLVSSFANDTIQRTQSFYFGANFELPIDEDTGEPKKAENGSWIIAQSTQDGKSPSLDVIESNLDGTSTLTGIDSMRNEILRECFVPISTGDGDNSTGVAQSVISGWSATETDAARKEQLISGSEREQLDLILAAIQFVPTKILPDDDPIREVHSSDVDIKYIRSKAYDLNSKCNALAVLLAHGIEARQAIKATNVFDDSEQAFLDSAELIKKYQDYTFGGDNDSTKSEETLVQTIGDQEYNSPIIGGTETDQNNESMGD